MRTRNAMLVAATACLALTGCSRETKAPEKEPHPVRVATVEQHGGQARTRYSATIEPFEQVTLAFKSSGYVREVKRMRGADGQMRNLQEGDTVSTGMILARVQDSDYVARLQQAQASVAEAQAGVVRAKLDYERAERLFQSQSLTKPDLDAARSGLDTGQARLDAAKAKQVEAEISLGDTIVKSPGDGVVLKRQIEMGSLVSAGSPAFVIARTESVKAVFGVPDWLARQAQLGATYPVRVDSFGGQEFPGRITAISPIADSASRLFQVELTVRNPKGSLKPGFIATVEVPEADPQAARAQASALVVPLAAIVRPKEGQFAVLVMEGSGARGTVRLRAIEVGEVIGNMVAVRKGLSRGERVVVTGPSLLTDGEAVQIIP